MRCGTLKGWETHRTLNEPPCRFCAPYDPRLANPKKQVIVRAPRAKKTPSGRPSRARPKSEHKQRTHKPIPCGTNAAAQRHMRAKEPLDPACRQARRTYSRESKQKMRDKQKAGTQ